MENKTSGYGFWGIAADLGLTGWLIGILKYLWPMVRLEPIMRLPPDERAWVKIYLGRMLESAPANLATLAFLVSALFLLWKFRRWHWIRRIKWLAIIAVTTLLIAVPPGVSLFHTFGVQLGLWGAVPSPTVKPVIELSPGLESGFLNCVGSLGALALLTLVLLMAAGWFISLVGKTVSPEYRKLWDGHSLARFGMTVLHTFLFMMVAAVAFQTDRPDAALFAAMGMGAAILEFLAGGPEEYSHLFPGSLTSWIVFLIIATIYIVINVSTAVVLIAPYVEKGVEMIVVW